jgi:putative DNA primase/helicase
MEIELELSLALNMDFKLLPIYGYNKSKCQCGKIDCSVPMKHPITRHGVLDATANTHIIKSWINKNPGCNWAIATGELSGVTVLDVDFGSGGAESTYFSSEVLEAIQDTAKVKTGNGFHAYFSYEEGIKNKVGLYSGIDVRNNGGYVLIPPSTHYSGKKYKWLAQKAFLTMPVSLAAFMVEKSDNMSDEFEDAEAMIPEGRRNAALFYFGSSMRARGLSIRAIHAALHEENQLKCSPPLLDWELKMIIDSISKYEAGESGMGLHW